MTNPMTAALADNAFRIENNLRGRAYGCADSDHGLVEVRLVHAESPCLGRQEHSRKTWYLNGKRIAAKKLEALFI